MDPTTAVVLQTPTPGLGPEELEEVLPELARLAWFVGGLAVVVAIGWFLLEPAVSRFVRRRNRGNATLQEAITRYVRLLVVVLGALVGAVLAGYGRFLGDSALVVAAATLALGVAAQTVIGSLVSGLVLVHDPEFNVGNYIRWEGGEGVVQSITLRVTRVLTPDGELVTIPNTVLTGGAVRRPYGRGRYRVVEHVGIAYEADVEAALGHLQAAAVEVDAVLAEPPPAAYVDEFGSDAIAVRVHYWIRDPRKRDLFRVRSEFARGAKARLDEAGIAIAPPSKRELLGRIGVDDGG